MTPNYKFRYILWLSGILIAIMGAAFSIFGLSKVFATYSLYIIILGIGIEIGKIVTISHLTQNWKWIKKTNKWSLSVLVSILMFVTSVGVFGFLSNAYQSTAYQLENVDKKISIVQNKKKIFQNEIEMYDKQIESKQERSNQLTSLRKQQENRINTLYDKNMTGAAKTTMKFIGDADQNINTINLEINDISKKISHLNDSIIKYDMIIAEMSNNQFAVDLGPLKYLAKSTGYSMDEVVGFFIILLILVIDPLAVILIISSNELIVLWKNEKIKKDEKRRRKEDEEEDEREDDGIIGNHAKRLTPLPKPETIIEEIVKEVKIEQPKEEMKKEKIKLDVVDIRDFKPIQIDFDSFKTEEKIEEPIEEEPIIEEQIIEDEPIEEEVINDNTDSIEPVLENIEQEPEKPKFYKTIVKRIGHRMFRTQRVEVKKDDDEN